jgi:putative ABC transport system ATP-binding protein
MPHIHVATPPSLLPRPAAHVMPVLRLQAVGLGAARLSFSAYAGEIVCLQGGTPALRLRLLWLAAGHAQGGSGSCELLGHEIHGLHSGALRALREQQVGQVLAGDTLPRLPTVLDCVAQPLLQRGVPWREALSRAALELDALGATPLAQCCPASLAPAQAHLVLLARASAPRPRLLVLERPEAGLPPTALSAVRLGLWALSSAFKTCVLMSTEHPRLAATADRCIDIDRDTDAGRAVLS